MLEEHCGADHGNHNEDGVDVVVKLATIEGDHRPDVVPLIVSVQPMALSSGVKVSATIAALLPSCIRREKDTPPPGSCTAVILLSRTGIFVPLKNRDMPDEQVSRVVENPAGSLTLTAVKHAYSSKEMPTLPSWDTTDHPLL